MAHNPSDAMVRLMHVAVSGVSTLVGIALCGVGAVFAFTTGDGSGRATGYTLMIAGFLLFSAAGGRTLYLVIDWRRHRSERSGRP